jgi:sn-glycerol 3-phosphate transport system ATP-binding protein
MVFQNYALYPHMTVRDNMAFSLMLARQPKSVADERVRKAADILGLGALLDRYPRQLSGGQRQRVAMGRCIVRDPQVFLFDEPLSNLDAKLRVQTRLEIQKLHRELGVTSLFVTHDQVEAMTLAQRIIVMNGGRIEQIGTPEAVYGQPASTFVASFIGSPAMNLLPGRQHGGQFLIDGAALDVPPGVEGELTLGLRPEHAQLADRGWPLRVEMIEMLGAERLVYGKLGAATPFTLRLDATLPSPQAGDWLHLAFNPLHLHRFDAQTGQRM